MKHYICMEENQMIYVCGTYANRRYKVVKADFLILPREAQEQAVREFAARNKLAGKRVNLALDSDIFFSVLSLPKAKPAQLREMARNELTHTVGKGEPLIISSLPYRDHRDGTSTTVLTYALPAAAFYHQTGLLGQAGIRCGKVYVRSNCMGHLAAGLFPDKKTMILAEAGEDYLRLQLIENGYCLLARTVRLNIGHFCETGAFGLLYDEISEQVSKAIQFHKSRNRSDEVELITIASDVLPDIDGAVSAIGVNLSIPCEAAIVPVEVSGGVTPELTRRCRGALSVMSKHRGRKAREVELASAERHTRIRDGRLNNGSVLFKAGPLFLCSVLVLAGLWGTMKIKNHFTAGNIQKLNSYIAYAGRQEGYRKAVDQQTQVSGLREYQRLAREREDDIRGRNLFSLDDYQVFKNASSGSVHIRGIRFTGGNGVCEVDIRADDPQAFAGVIEQVRATGHFKKVSYDHWEYVELPEQSFYYTVTISAAHGEGDVNEAE